MLTTIKTTQDKKKIYLIIMCLVWWFVAKLGTQWPCHTQSLLEKQVTIEPNSCKNYMQVVTSLTHHNL